MEGSARLGAVASLLHCYLWFFSEEGQLSVLLGFHEGLRLRVRVEPGAQLVAQPADGVGLGAVVVDALALLVVDLLVHDVGEAAPLADYRRLEHKYT